MTRKRFLTIAGVLLLCAGSFAAGFAVRNPIGWVVIMSTEEGK